MCDKNPNWPLINCWLLLLSSFVFACKPKKRIWHTYVKSHGALNCTFICKGFYCGPEKLKKNNRNEVGGRSDSCGSKIQVVPKNYYNLYFFKPKAKLRYHHIIAIFVIISIIIIIIILAIMQLRPCENWDFASQWLFLNSSSLQYPHTNSPDRSEYISSKNKLREFDKRSKHLGQPLYTSERILLCVYFHLPSGVSAHKCIPVKWDFKVWWLSAWLQSLFLFSFYNYFITVF